MRTPYVSALVLAVAVAACGKDAPQPAPKAEPPKPAAAAPKPPETPVAAADATTARMASTRFAGPVQLTPGATFQQRFKVTRPGMKGVSFQVVTFGKTPSPYKVDWKLSSVGAARELARGTIDAARATDWQTIDVTPASAPRGEETEFELSFAVPPGSAVAAPLGVPLFHPLDAAAGSPVSPTNTGVPVLGLTVRF